MDIDSTTAATGCPKPRAKLGKADATMRRILAVTLARIIQQGESGISMTDISREVGVSRPTIYRYFPTREALLEGAFGLLLEDFEAGMRAAIERRPAPEQRLEVIADFLESRLLDGGVQLFQLEPKLIIDLIMGSKDKLRTMTEFAYGPLFDMADGINEHKVDRDMVADVILLFFSSLSLLTVKSRPHNIGLMLRKTIRAVLHITRNDP
ncbi:MAG: TetR/AcrR family transcriptional regulator [Porticoccaceae bacterium]